MSSDPNKSGATVDASEVARFSAMADQWWDPTGKFRPLHQLNPVRLAYIKEAASRQFDRDVNDPQALKGLRVLDIGCGGGLLSEPMARLGATVVGADPSPTNIEIARLHSARSGLEIDFRATDAESLAADGETFDIVLNMEVVEHVADVPLFLNTCAEMVRPGGLMFVATMNRTLKAYALAIVGAEYILRWLPRGTHQWDKFLRPDELESMLTSAGLVVDDMSGISFDPLRDNWRRTANLDVNYMLSTHKPR
ncbi:MAG: bifunctional 3-demethylubiquinol 3-O-methyltransferase/2-polyprenyl-6-hydroxyphenol methylase [Hyphomicrobiales bacterium]|nr:MAG: bifunctional 3-demethylubiquinol 3-O-methyltransferase/2-polyprenyl-6-hydroxyphenol methylase [Hyphomicrobiales bacterium]